MNVSDYDYELPADRIAQVAIEPRDASRLLIGATLRDIPFRDLPALLRPDDLIIVNATRVRHARLSTTREDTGGAVEVLLVRRMDDVRWQAMLRPARRLRDGVRLIFADRVVTLLSDPVGGVASVAIDPPHDVEEVIDAHGAVPLPPYFTGSLDDDERYQTIFSRTVGSAAAPTAALHFTRELVERIRAMGVRFAEVELEVGLDTFRPMTGTEVEDHDIHTERMRLGERTADEIRATRLRGGRVIAVGTTVVRTLESAATPDGLVAPYDGPTDLFITPGYRPRVVDAMITNFHAPRTTLLVLVAALVGERWRDLYDHALSDGFRFLSFGDAMFLEVER